MSALSSALRLSRLPLKLSLGQWLLVVGALSLALRAWLSLVLPLTGDEAQFYWWAVFLDWGYYDHPPMVAWWMALARAVGGDAPWSLRLPAVILPLGVGAALWWGLSGWDRRRAAWAVLLFWLTPVAWLNMLITTDTPLMFWSAWSVAALWRAQQARERGASPWGCYVLSGLCLGAAFLSKYFAVLLGLSYAVYFVLFERRGWVGLAVIVLSAVPAALANLGWNLTHCWANIMFNLYNRNEGATFSWGKPALYAVMMAYLLGPTALWLSAGHLADVSQALKRHRLLACVIIVPLACFGILSGGKVIGLHWVLAFYPFIFVALAWALPPEALRSARRGSAAFVAMHVVIVLGLSMTSLPQWQHLKAYPRLVQALRSEQMIAQVQAPGVVLMTVGYAPSSVYGYALKRHLPVFGVAGFHARHDDLVVDYAAFEGRTLRIVRRDRPPSLVDYTPYFSAVRVLRFSQDGVPFYAVEGENFNYAAYRQGIMGEINRRYYRFPSWLPVWDCPFCRRYCGQARCAS